MLDPGKVIIIFAIIFFIYNLVMSIRMNYIVDKEIMKACEKLKEDEENKK